jgi:CheY-like chemotaxis protein
MTRDVLIIDDSATVRKLVEISLRGAPLAPHFATLGAEGIRRAAALEPAAIVLDFVLPDMTAIDVCRALEANPRTRRIPVVVVTAKDARSRAELAPFRAVVDFIAKPFVGPDLLARIERAIAGTRAPRSTDPVERAAKLLFARLRDGLEQIPTLQLAPGAVAPQLARHLLTPEVVARIVADLRALDDAGPARSPRDHLGGEQVTCSPPRWSRASSPTCARSTTPAPRARRATPSRAPT